MNGVLIDFAPPAVLDPSPNTTQPLDTRIVSLPQSSSGNATLWLSAVGAGGTLELWFAPTVDVPATWIKLTTAAAITPADRATIMLPLGGVPADCPLFVRVAVVGAMTRVLGGLTRA